MAARVELELTDEASDGMIAVEQKLREIVEKLRGHVQDYRLKFFTIEGWSDIAARGTMREAYHQGNIQEAWRLWVDLQTEHELHLNLLTLARAGMFRQGADRFVEMEAGDREFLGHLI